MKRCAVALFVIAMAVAIFLGRSFAQWGNQGGGGGATNEQTQAEEVMTNDFAFAGRVNLYSTGEMESMYESLALEGPGLVAWWELNETNGFTAYDSSGNGNDGSLTNSPVRITGVFSNALSLTATSNQYVRVEPSGTVTGTFTVSAWVMPQNPSSSAVMTFFSTRTGGENFDIKLMWGGLIQWDIGNGSDWIVNQYVDMGSYATGMWYHVACVVTPTNTTTYLNGAVIGSGDYDVSEPLLWNAPNNDVATIGGAGNNWEIFDGGVDDVQVYNWALGSNDVATLYNAADSDSDGIPDWWTQKYFGHPTGQEYDHSRAGDDPDGDGVTNLDEYHCAKNPLTSKSHCLQDGMVGWWEFNETGGNIAEDSSGLGNDGVLTNSPIRISGVFSNALSLTPASNQYVRVEPSGTVTGTFTVSAWVQPMDSSSSALLTFFSTRTGGNYFDIKLMWGNLIQWDIGNGSSWVTNHWVNIDTYTTGRWYHVACVVTPTNTSTYVDGSIVGSGNYGPTTPKLWEPGHKVVTIGGAGNNWELFKGGMDDAQVYIRALTAVEIAAIHDEDTDGDGLSNADELNIYHTDPNNPDTDGDGMPDGWEVQYNLSPTTNDAGGDFDGDGVNNLTEYLQGRDPTKGAVADISGLVNLNVFTPLE